MRLFDLGARHRAGAPAVSEAPQPVTKAAHVALRQRNSYRMRQHADLFNTLLNNPAAQETETST